MSEPEPVFIFDWSDDIRSDDDDGISVLLRSWNLYEKLSRSFKEQEIDLAALICISDSDINELIPQVGVRAKFKKYLYEWRVKEGHVPISPVDTLSPTSSFVSNWIIKQSDSESSAPASPTTSRETVNNLDIQHILEENYLSKASFEYYRIHNCLNDFHRKNVITAIINFCLKNDIKLRTDDFRKIVKSIKEIFPSEDEASYFIERTDNTQPRGTLYNKYHNALRKLREEGCLERYNKAYKRKFDEPDSNIEEKDNDGDQSDKIWLQFKNSPWSVVEEKWIKTRNQRRLELIGSTDKNICDFIKSWPLYKNPAGHRLIEIDFAGLYEKHSDKFLLDFDHKSQKIIEIGKEKKFPVELTENKDVFALNVIRLIHNLLPPVTRFKCNEYHWKPSIQDSINSMVLFASGEIYMQEKITEAQEELKKKNLILQPCVIVILDNDIPSKFFVSVDNIIYLQFSLLAVIDLCFKIFHVFNLQYPRQSHNVWYFIQKYFYELETADDKKSSSVSNLCTLIIGK